MSHAGSRRLACIAVALVLSIEAGLTMIVRDETDGASSLAYVNRSQVDLLRGFFGPLVRNVLEGRVERQASSIIRGLRTRLEGGNPSEGSLNVRSRESTGVR